MDLINKRIALLVPLFFFCLFLLGFSVHHDGVNDKTICSFCNLTFNHSPTISNIVLIPDRIERIISNDNIVGLTFTALDLYSDRSPPSLPQV